MDTNSVFNMVNMLILATGITVTVLSLDLIFRYSLKWYLFLPLLVWAIHLTIFYFLIIYAGLMGTTIDILFNMPNLFNSWSTLQRFDGVATMLFMTILLSVEIKYNFFKSEKENKSLREKD
jgi:hypothetical protein